MYFPFLRGRQFELIALRELVEKDCINDFIFPIIEPVKLSSTLISTIQTFRNKGLHIAVINNPKVGNLFADIEADIENHNHKKLQDEYREDLVVNALYLKNDLIDFLPELLDKGIDLSETIAICENRDMLSVYESVYTNKKPQYCLIPCEIVYKRRVKTKTISLADRFSKKSRNTDYAITEDEPFSDDHLYYKEEGFSGFSDYSIVGDEYSESGFAPYAVAIHIVYFSDDMSLRVHHFVSDTNDDITDPAGKFAEALGKLVVWNNTKRLHTYAVREFEKMYEQQTYPGLGTVKKLSIMHHIELMNEFLNGAQKK